MNALRKADVYLGAEACYVGHRTGFAHARWSDDKPRAIVAGTQFGPMLLCVGADLAECIDEWDERYGERVDVDKDASTLADYAGDDVAARIESAMADGDIRVNDGGTMVWVDHYEWFRTFTTVREAGRFYRNGGAP